MTRKESVRQLLTYLHGFKSAGADDIHPKVLKELAEGKLELPAILFAKSWMTGKFPEDCKKTNIGPDTSMC